MIAQSLIIFRYASSTAIWVLAWKSTQERCIQHRTRRRIYVLLRYLPANIFTMRLGTIR